ncbi:MAG: Tfp pilus assembly protein PilF [Bradymonadia bacterium]|jgi:Tfp pilus assembly protein PilF
MLDPQRFSPSLALVRALLVCGCATFAAGTFGCSAATQARQEEANEQSDFHYRLSIGHYNAQEVPIAIRELNHSLELNPENVDALYLLGFIYQGRRDYEEAERLYTIALSLADERHDIRNALGTVYLETERWEAAEELFRALTRIPTYFTPGHAHNNLGWALMSQGDHSQAVEQFELAVLFQPELCPAYNNRGIAQEELGLLRAAERAYEDAIERCSSYAEPRYRLGVLLWREGEIEAAEELFEECEDMGPNSDFGRRCAEYLYD